MIGGQGYTLAVQPPVMTLCEAHSFPLQSGGSSMSRSPKPYIKCDRRGDMLHLTLMRSTGRALIRAGTDSGPRDDWHGLREAVVNLITKARLAERSLEIQADGDSQ